MLDLDYLSPDGYNVQGRSHAGRTCAHFESKEPSPSEMHAPIKTAVSPHQLKTGHMFI
jgi:hypothetical protein